MPGEDKKNVIFLRVYTNINIYKSLKLAKIDFSFRLISQQNAKQDFKFNDFSLY